MPIARHRIKNFTMKLALIVSIICILIVFSTTFGLLAQNADALPVQYENPPQLPAAITEAYLQVGEPYEEKLNWPKEITDRNPGALPDKAPPRRDLRFTAKIANQSAFPITQFRLAIENPAFLPNQIITIVCRLSGATQRTANNNQPLKPNEFFTFSRKLSLEDSQGDRELVKHVSDFRLKVIGVSYSSQDDQLWLQSFLVDYDEEGMIVSRGLKDFSDTPRAQYIKTLRDRLPASAQNGQSTAILTVTPQIYGDPKILPRKSGTFGDPAEVPTPSIPIVTPEGQEGSATGEASRPMTASLKPTILYKEKPKYTQDALVNRIQGTVVLNVVFGADGRISQIRVVRGLPDGLTEKAIEAARKTRFQPAVSNGAPVSVRGNLEFSFALDN